ncbi:hypothetical protein UA08_08628 [Talaromyces atroroseus]|uniref:Secreted protein n=1 Tax=Talaromyces atroroseus TaxID=1441469 RepID=A0A225ADE3_TALAT|nr:hypothetical protein UA08_08628 [Talaromyces atroroseus]OKL55944.1 hypothetical protein UA08_08628 [Talaromyces atroroseus]
MVLNIIDTVFWFAFLIITGMGTEGGKSPGRSDSSTGPCSACYLFPAVDSLRSYIPSPQALWDASP